MAFSAAIILCQGPSSINTADSENTGESHNDLEMYTVSIGTHVLINIPEGIDIIMALLAKHPNPGTNLKDKEVLILG